MTEESNAQQVHPLSIVAIAVIVIVLLSMCSTIMGDGGGSRDVDLNDPDWDLYFECTERQRKAGYSLVEAGNRCETLRPE